MASTVALSDKDQNGRKIVNLGVGSAATDAANTGQITTAYANAISRANHQGTQLAATISDFDTQVRSSRLDQIAQPTAAVSFNNQRQTNLADPTAAQDSATKNYVDNTIAGLTTGQVLKGTVRAAATTNVNTSAPGATIDGVTASNGDVFLLTAQTTASQNGPWQFNGAAVAMTRPANWDTSAEAVLGSYWIVREGSNADRFALLTNDTAVTLGTTALTFTFIYFGTPSVTGYTTQCPAIAAGGTWIVTHGLGSRFILAQVARVAAPYDIVDVRIERTSTTTVSVLPDVAMSSGEYEIMINKVA